MATAPIIPGVDRIVAVTSHTGEAARCVRALKYGRDTRLVTPLADALARVAPEADLVTWVPSTRAHRLRRGFDQSELLARAVARRLDVRARRLLVRSDAVAQTDRDGRGRRAGPVLVPVGRRPPRKRPTVLVVDDVCTTGATMVAAARAVRLWGARSVVAAVVTVAPVRRGTNAALFS